MALARSARRDSRTRSARIHPSGCCGGPTAGRGAATTSSGCGATMPAMHAATASIAATLSQRSDARLLADLYAHNASRQIPQKGRSDQTVACLRRLGAGVVGSAAACAFRFRPPGTGSKRAGWRRSGAVLFAFFGAVCFEPDASCARLRFKAVMRSMTGGGAAISLGLTASLRSGARLDLLSG